MPCAHFPGTLAEGDHHVQIHCAESRFGTRLLQRGAQAAVGDVDPPGQLRKEYRRVAHRVFQVRVLGQWPACRRQDTGDGGLVEQAV
ncbi:hypothetical protein D3C75_912400 [compost metagenome]